MRAMEEKNKDEGEGGAADDGGEHRVACVRWFACGEQNVHLLSRLLTTLQ